MKHAWAWFRTCTVYEQSLLISSADLTALFTVMAILGAHTTGMIITCCFAVLTAVAFGAAVILGSLWRRAHDEALAMYRDMAGKYHRQLQANLEQITGWRAR